MSDLVAAATRAVAVRIANGWARADAAEQALAVVRATADDDDLSAALAVVVEQYSLTPEEADLFAVAAAAEQSVSLHLLLGLLSGDDSPGRPTVALALELAGLTPDGRTARALFGPLSTLRRFGLITVDGDDVLLSRRVVLPERVAGFLADDDLPPRFLLPALLDATPVDVEGTDVVVAALRAEHRLVWVHEQRGGAGVALATAACRELDLGCLVADLSRLPASAVDDAVVALLLEAGLTGQVLVLAAADLAGAHALGDTVVPVLAVSTEPWDPRTSTDFPVTVAAPPLSVAQRQALWQPVLGADARAVTGMPLTPDQIVLVARHATQVATLHGESTVSVERVRDSARALSRGRAVRANASSSVTLDDLMLPEATLVEFERLVDWARYRDQVASMGSFYGKGGKGTGICALFSGPPGTGKTLGAHVIADTLGMDLYQVDLSAIVDKYIGETEKNLERAFVEAESTNAVLFFDEADALFGTRSEVKDSKDRYANQEIAYLLQRVERFDGIAVLASNLRGNIDPAFARRLHFMIQFPEPDEPTRRRLWAHHLDTLPPSSEDPIDLDRLAKSIEIAGGNIRNIVLSAVHAAVAQDQPVGMDHVLDATRREYIKLGRRPPAL